MPLLSENAEKFIFNNVFYIINGNINVFVIMKF